MVALATVFVEGRVDTSRFGSDIRRGMSTTSATMASSGTAASKSFGSTFTSGLSRAAKLGGVILGGAAIYGAVSFAKNSVTLEAQFSKTMNVMGAVAKVPQAQLGKLSDLAIQMGQDTVFSANDAAQAMLELAKNGISPAVIKSGALKEALTLAAAGGIDMASAATTMGNAINTFSLKGKDAASVAAALAGAANASSADIGSLAEGLQQAGTVAADAGLSVQETTGVLAAFANAGIKGSDAGTSLKTALSRLVPASNEAFDAMNQYGLVTYDANIAAKTLAQDGIKAQSSSFEDVSAAVGDYLVQQGVAEKGTVALSTATSDYLKVTGIMHNDFVKQNGDFKSISAVADELQKSFGDLSQSERASALNTIFGSDARRAATILTNEGSKGLAKYIKATSDETAADKAAAAQMKGTAGAIEQRKGSMETLSLAFGLAIAPLVEFGNLMVADIANKAVPIVQNLGDKLKGLIENGPSIGELGKTIGAAFAGIDWSAFQDLDLSGFKDLGDDLPTFNDLLNVAGVVLKFAADHVDLLAKALPFLAAGFLAVKFAQLASNAAAAVAVPVRIAEVVTNRALARSNYILVTAIRSQSAALGQATVGEVTNTGAKNSGILASVRARIATIAKAVAEKAAAVASKAMAAAQWLINAAMSANPIGIVVKVLAALVGALVLAYASSDDFRRVVDKAWAAIKQGIASAWNYVKPILLSFGNFLAHDLGPAIKDLWSNVVKPVFKGIGETIAFAWNNIIKPVFKLLGDFLVHVLGPTIKWLWDKIVKPVFKGIGETIKFWWNYIVKPVFNAWKTFFESVLFPVIKFLWNNIIKPVFKGIGETISFAWNRVIKPVFETLGSFIEDKVAPAFGRGVKLIGDAWEGLKNLVATPINAVIRIINKYLIGGVNTLANAVGFSGDPLGDIPEIALATGGILPGYTPGRDVHKFYSPTGGRLALSGGEAIMRPEFAKAVGGKKGVDELNKRAMAHGVFHFAGGGIYRPVASGSFGPIHDTDTPYPGVDIGVPVGTTVHSAAPGRVSSSYDIPGYEPRITDQNGYKSYGKVMTILHDGFATLYAHLSARGLAAGATVLGGQPIALSGDTGYSFGPHLHFGAQGVSPVTLMGGSTDYSGGDHIDVTGASVNGVQLPTFPSWVLDAIKNPTGYLQEKIAGALGSLGSGSIIDTIKSVPTKAIGMLSRYIQEKLGPIIPGGPAADGGILGPAIDFGNAGIIKGVQTLASKRGWGSGSEWSSLSSLVNAESSWNPTAQNPTSSAYGLFQFLDATWATVGGHKTSDPALQTKYGLRYIAQNYTDPIHAWKYHLANNSYDGGGMARGAGFMPKITAAPERVLSPRQTTAFEKMMSRGGLGPSSTQRIELDLGEGLRLRGVMRAIADGSVADNGAFVGTTGRMR